MPGTYTQVENKHRKDCLRLQETKPSDALKGRDCVLIKFPLCRQNISIPEAWGYFTCYFGFY